MRAFFVAVNMFVLGMFLGGAALYIVALATGTVVFNPEQIAPCAFCIALALGFFIASYKVERHSKLAKKPQAACWMASSTTGG